MRRVRQISLWMLLILLFSTSCYALKERDVWEDKGSFWNGRVWFGVRSHDGGEPEKSVTWMLYSVEPGSEEKPRVEAGVSIPLELFWLFDGEDRLWVISAESVGYYKDGQLTFVDMKNKLTDITKPFLYNGRPAVVDNDGYSLTLYTLGENEWTKGESFTVKHNRPDKHIWWYMEVIADQDILHLFLQNKDGLIYHFEGIPTGEYEDVTQWELLARMGGYCCGGYWASVIFKDQVTIFYPVGGLLAHIEGFKLVENKWKRFFKPKASIYATNCYGVYPTGQNDDFLLLHDSEKGWLEAITFQNGEEISRTMLGSKLTLYNLSIKIIAYAILIVPVVLLIFFFVRFFRNPFKLSRFALTRFHETKEYPREKVDVAAIMNAEFKKIKGLNVKKWPEKNAISVRHSFFQSSANFGFTPLIPAIIEFEEAGRVVKVTMTVKMPLTMVILFVLMILLICIFLPFAIWAWSSTSKNKCSQFFHLFLVSLGIEEAVDANELI
ncbi:MAG TPA: hypothetical protein PKH33_16930 [bacterium]|nr:hypothetical protein [bacterium]